MPLPAPAPLPTCRETPADRAATLAAQAPPLAPRDARLREAYRRAFLAAVPRLLGAIDRNPLRATYGCLDRQFWHYRTSPFPSEMYQEGVLPLAMLHAIDFPGNRWHGDPRVRDLAVAALRFSARAAHRDGSCDDYYPFERALGAAVFSLLAAARAYRLLALDDAELRAAIVHRAQWVATHGESGQLTNHHALAGRALWEVALLTGDAAWSRAAEEKFRGVIAHQHAEGWFEEYGGADPGYQTVTIDCLANYRREAGVAWLDEPLRRAVAFARAFVHPDLGYAGEYGSRGTYHAYPHGFELLADHDPAAADVADALACGLASGRAAGFDDDRMFAHRLAGWLDAWLDWAPRRAVSGDVLESTSGPAAPAWSVFPAAGLVVRHAAPTTIVSTARGGTFKLFVSSAERALPDCVTDVGLFLETATGRVAVANQHGRERAVTWEPSTPADDGTPAIARLTVQGTLAWVRWETATPLKQALFHVGMQLVGRHCRTLVRRLLQRRLITGRRAAPVRFTREITWHDKCPHTETHSSGTIGATSAYRVTVRDTIELLDARLRVRRLALATEGEPTYVAAGGVYHDAVLRPWTWLDERIDELNSRRRITVERSW